MKDVVHWDWLINNLSLMPYCVAQTWRRAIWHQPWLRQRGFMDVREEHELQEHSSSNPLLHL